MQNGYVESFNGRMRDEPLNETLLFDLDQEARQLIGAWVAHYNTARPHSSLGLPDASSLCRPTDRAGRRNNRRGSNGRWTKVQWQVRRCWPRNVSLIPPL